MINLILGQPGGGKSYESVAFHVIPAVVEQGRKVITNLPLALPVWESYWPGCTKLIEIREPKLIDGEVVRPFSKASHYGDPWRHPETGVGPLYVIDECHLAIPLKGPDPEQQTRIEEWFSLHRHELADVLLITQSYGKINKAIRDLVQVVYRCKKATAFGVSSRYIRKVQDGLRGEVVNTTDRKYEKKYFPLYKSHTRSSNAAQELGANDIVPVWKHWSFKASAVCLVGLLFLIPRLEHPFKPKVHAAEGQQAPVAAEEIELLPSKAERSQPTGKPKREQKEETARSKAHPFEGYGLHLAAIMHGQRDGKDVLKGLLRMTQNGQVVNTMNFEDLVKAGYAFTMAGDCVLSLSYQGLDLGFVVCDSPKVGLASKIPGNAKAEG